MAIEFERVSYTTPSGVPVVDRLSFTVEAGEVMALVGRSGAGKTTLLKLVNRLLVQDSGRVMVDGRETGDWNVTRLRRSIGYVIQDVGLFPHMTVAGNIGVVPRLEGWSPQRIHTRVAELLELVGLPPSLYGGRWPDQLSGGQRQRVGVARALAADPPILLMDEPFGALDPLTRAELHEQFHRIQERVRKTVMLVTHDMAEALSLGDRLAVLEAGALVACDTPAGIVATEDARVRRFVDAVSVRVRGAPGPP